MTKYRKKNKQAIEDFIEKSKPYKNVTILCYWDEREELGARSGAQMIFHNEERLITTKGNYLQCIIHSKDNQIWLYYATPELLKIPASNEYMEEVNQIVRKYKYHWFVVHYKEDLNREYNFTISDKEYKKKATIDFDIEIEKLLHDTTPEEIRKERGAKQLHSVKAVAKLLKAMVELIPFKDKELNSVKQFVQQWPNFDKHYLILDTDVVHICSTKGDNLQMISVFGEGVIMQVGLSNIFYTDKINEEFKTFLVQFMKEHQQE